MFKSIVTIIKKEIKLAVRERLALLLGSIILLLMGVSLISGYRNFQQEHLKITKEQEQKRTEWLSQGDKHPHIAAHYGTYVFKPKSILGIFDSGLDGYTGTSIYLEAHYQHEFMFRPAQDKGTMVRFGELTMAMALQVLTPLLIIILAFRSITQERESGTLRLVAAQGVPINSFVWGKILTYGLILLLILLPILLATVVGITLLKPMDLLAFSPWRLVFLFLVYTVYLFIFIVFSVCTSLYSKTSRNALLKLLVFWVLLTVLIPKTVSNLGRTSYSLPSMHTFKSNIQNDIDNGLDGKTSRSVRMARLKQEYLEAYEVDSLHQLPFNFDGISMQAGEEHTHKVYDVHWQQLRSIFEEQNTLFAYSSLLNPYIAVQRLSMAFSGTDMYTAIDFEDEVEHYRRALVEKMNNDMAQNSRYGGFYEYKAGASLWKEIEEFNYTMPTMNKVLHAYKWELISLLAWLFLALFLLSTVTSKKRWNI
ncbi:ABC transporter permease [Flagellimonas eckloniae]|uniref:ABC transporter permease n=1 Tax=Flagellimonas eckloniae TaxID=346185 RepID=A0A0Q1CHE8_9FLAO|nr:DUF3526 domain-containing protein [Allomuricauda eckloniae]KQC30356.1 hypothetical protein AAY42_11065 [Allomuricauda eckloniae]